MLQKIIEPGPTITEGRLLSFANGYNLDLPKTYRDFLLRNNGGRPVPAAFPIKGFSENPFGVIDAFFGLGVAVQTEDLDNIMAELIDSIPIGVLPIACTESDDFICIDLREVVDGAIVYWDRRPFWGNNIWNESDLYRVADNFALLLTKLDDF